MSNGAVSSEVQGHCGSDLETVEVTFQSCPYCAGVRPACVNHWLKTAPSGDIDPERFWPHVHTEKAASRSLCSPLTNYPCSGCRKWKPQTNGMHTTTKGIQGLWTE